MLPNLDKRSNRRQMAQEGRETRNAQPGPVYLVAVQAGSEKMSPTVRADLFQPVTTRSTVRNVVDQLLDRLKAGVIDEGDFLPSERTLAATMGVSRRTIRAAVKVLMDLGLVEVLPGSAGGVKVVSIWVPDDLADSDAELQAGEIFSVLEARRTLEPRLAQLAASRGTDEHFAAMQQTIDLQWEHRGEREKVSQMNSRFHRMMWRAAGNATLEAAIKLVYRELAIAFDMTVRTPSDTGLSIELHERTLTALTRGDPAEIDEVMDEHLAYLEDICESVLGRRRVREEPDFLKSRARARTVNDQPIGR
jgi:GntR family transcriptional repressor for pyruvate dehydrogenase complex